MVLVLQLDDDGIPARHGLPTDDHTGGIDASGINVRTRIQRIGDRKGSPPPAYSTVSSPPYQLSHLANLRLDQPWVRPTAGNSGVRVSIEKTDHGDDAAAEKGVTASDKPPGTSEAGNASTNEEKFGSSDSVIIPSLARLMCAYPVVISLVSHLDLTDMSSLSLSCIAVRNTLSQFRSQVLAHTLRCVHEAVPRDPKTAAPPRWFPPCARDLVAPCRRCLQTVCRNCTAKPGGGIRPIRRHRRLCRTCQNAPVGLLGIGTVAEAGAAAAGDSKPVQERAGHCTCASIGVHICRSCDSGQNGADQTYTRVWSWRSRYRNLGFGLGTGLGEGNEGVKCGRGASCLAARDLIVDMDCAEALKNARNRGRGGSNPTVGDVAAAYLIGGGDRRSEDTPPTPSTPLTPMVVDSGILDAAGAGIGTASSLPPGNLLWEIGDVQPGPGTAGGHQQAAGQNANESAGYYRQEVEGIGGVVKKKLKKRVRVGATVTEYEDESQTGAFLERERTGSVRSWCAWCDRVIPSIADVEMIKRCHVGGT